MLMRCCASECLRRKGTLKLMRCHVQADGSVVCLKIKGMYVQADEMYV